MVALAESKPLTYEDLIRRHGEPVRFENANTGEAGFGIVMVRQFGAVVGIQTEWRLIITHVNGEANPQEPVALYPVLLMEGAKAG